MSKWLHGNKMTESFPRKYGEGKEFDRIRDLTLYIGMLQVFDVTTKSAADMELEEEGKIVIPFGRKYARNASPLSLSFFKSAHSRFIGPVSDRLDSQPWGGI